MKFGICSEIFEEWGDFTRTCDFIADVGYDGIEIAPFNFADDVKDISPETREGIVQDAATAGVEVIGLHWLLVGPEGLHVTCPDDATRARTAEYLIDLARFCGEIGGTRMIFGSPKQRNLEEGQAYQEGFDNARGVFEKVLPTLEEHGIVLCMEPLAESETDFCRSAKEAVALIEAVDHPS
ncbi:MAG: sugar phosphate isomerase/epimerase, partial [Candidatus Hydrogenedentes bacterium]|nr:sugar phosphate isomerase/epimerase [Candidatus Hydrogenedentota bacterium]